MLSARHSDGLPMHVWWVSRICTSLSLLIFELRCIRIVQLNIKLSLIYDDIVCISINTLYVLFVINKRMEIMFSVKSEKLWWIWWKENGNEYKPTQL